MRRLSSVAFAVPVVVMLVTAAGWMRPAEQAYPIICRGGPGIVLRLRVVDAGVLNRGNALSLDFGRSSTGAAQGVAPGTCAWQDRALSPSEPATLCWDGVDYATISVNAGRPALGMYSISTSDGESEANFGNSDAIVTGAANNPGDPNQLMYFRAQGGEARGERCLRVTHTGP